MLPTSNWREWYRSRHLQEWLQAGTAFEQYVTRVLARFHDDFANPAPTGRLGDGGCDGLAERGTILYACYGQRPMRSAEYELEAKLQKDFSRALECWPSFTQWRFVTNAQVGPRAHSSLVSLQQLHGPGSARPLNLGVWDGEKFWVEVVRKLDSDKLDTLFPGAPGIENLELDDLVPLLDSLGRGQVFDGGAAASIAPVPIGKMDYNELPEVSRTEFTAGRLMAPRIDRWYAEAADPTLGDVHGRKFSMLYRDAGQVCSEPSEILERLYVAIAGANFRMDGKRSNAAYAIVSYFFDSCHIFEVPPAEGGDGDAAAN